jgi:hypothetical protein
VRREVDALEETGLSGHVHRQAFFEGGYHELPLRNTRFRVASDEPVLRRCRPPSSAEPECALWSQWWKPSIDQIRVSYLHCALPHVLQYSIPFGYRQFRDARKIRACFIPR